MTEAWAIQISPKTPDGTLVNLRAESPEHLDYLIQAIEDRAAKIAGLIGSITAAGNVAPIAAPAAQQPTQPAAWAAPPAPQQAPQAPSAWAAPPAAAPGQAPSCHHGVKVFRQAKPESGKSWKGWFCPAPKGTPDQCQPEFIR